MTEHSNAVDEEMAQHDEQNHFRRTNDTNELQAILKYILTHTKLTDRHHQYSIFL